MKGWFVTGIGTEVGKTIASAILVRALETDYWKPVQAGDLEHSDTMKVQALVGTESHFFPEAYRLNTPMSPHAAANIDGVDIQVDSFELPSSEKPILVEGAGGLMVPLNNGGETILGLMQHLQLPVILISRHYLGSINHTLLSVEVLKNSGLTLAGIVFNGAPNPETEKIIAHIAHVPILAHLNELEEINPQTIAAEAKRIAPALKTALQLHD